MVVTNDFRCRIYQNPFGSGPFWSHRSQIKKNWTLTNFFPLCSNIAPTISAVDKKIDKVFDFSEKLQLKVNSTHGYDLLHVLST